MSTRISIAIPGICHTMVTSDHVDSRTAYVNHDGGILHAEAELRMDDLVMRNAHICGEVWIKSDDEAWLRAMAAQFSRQAEALRQDRQDRLDRGALNEAVA